MSFHGYIERSRPSKSVNRLYTYLGSVGAEGTIHIQMGAMKLLSIKYVPGLDGDPVKNLEELLKLRSLLPHEGHRGAGRSHPVEPLNRLLEVVSCLAHLQITLH